MLFFLLSGIIVGQVSGNWEVVINETPKQTYHLYWLAVAPENQIVFRFNEDAYEKWIFLSKEKCYFYCSNTSVTNEYFGVYEKFFFFDINYQDQTGVYFVDFSRYNLYLKNCSVFLNKKFLTSKNFTKCLTK